MSLSRTDGVRFAIPAATIAIFLHPYFLLGTDFHALIHDNLDSLYVTYKVLVESGKVFAPNGTAVQQLFNGVPREALPSEYDVFVPMYWALGPYGAYVLNRTLMTLVAFLGMYLLLKRHVIPGDECRMIQSGVALSYSLLPFLPMAGLSVAGLPLVCYALLNLRANSRGWLNWTILILFPFYSSLVFSGLFIVLSFAALWAWDALCKRINWNLGFGIAVLALGYAFTNYRVLFNLFTASGFVSHRIEFTNPQMSLRDALATSWEILTIGQYHANSLHALLILPSAAVGGLLLFAGRLHEQGRLFLVLLSFVVATAGLSGLIHWGALQGMQDALFRKVPIQLDRFHFLHPLLWMLLFAIALRSICTSFRQGRAVVLLLLAGQVIYAFAHHENARNRSDPSIRTFFAATLFQRIADHIGRPKTDYRVASVGLHPAVALYNGFHTLDGYLQNYPLRYKHAFREIIKGEFDKDPALRQYFDGWGSRAYLFIAWQHNTRGYVDYRSAGKVETVDISINTAAFHAMGGEYIFSTLRLGNAGELGIDLEGTFRDVDSAWRIFLYRVRRAHGGTPAGRTHG